MAGVQCVLLLLSLTQAVCGNQYLLAMPYQDRAVAITAVSGSDAGWVKVKVGDMNPTEVVVIPYSRQLITINETSMASVGKDTKSIVVEASEEISITGSYRYTSFSPIPISSLGQKYILPFCCDARRKSVVVLAAYAFAIDADVRFKVNDSLMVENKQYKNGDVMTIRLGPYQTYSFIVDDDISGTVIESSSNVAVFLGSTLSNRIDTYDQLPPVSLYGDEYVVAVVDDREDHHLMIIGENDDTEVTFNDGQTMNGSLITRTLSRNESLHFASSKPVMATLCRNTRMLYYSAFVVIPPVSAYRRKKTSLYVPYTTRTWETTVKIFAKVSTYVEVERYTEEPIETDWYQIPGTDYKVGTCSVKNLFATSFDASDDFNIIAFNYYFVQNGGYGVDEDAKSMKVGGHGGEQEKLTAGEAGGNRPVIIVAILCGLLIVALVAVIATLAARMRRRSSSSGRGSRQQKATLMVRYRKSEQEPPTA